MIGASLVTLVGSKTRCLTKITIAGSHIGYCSSEDYVCTRVRGTVWLSCGISVAEYDISRIVYGYLGLYSIDFHFNVVDNILTCSLMFDRVCYTCRQKCKDCVWMEIFCK